MVHCLRKIVCQLPVKLLVVLLLMINLVNCNIFSTDESLPYYSSQDLTPIWNNTNHRIAKFNLVDQNGKSFGTESLNGKIYIANFFFTTCPSICPRMAKCLKMLQDSIYSMQQVAIVSFSVMPWVDSVNKLNQYGKENNIYPDKWHLLTGEKTVIYSLGRASFFADNNKLDDTSSFLHTDKMYLIDHQQKIRGVYNATNLNEIARVLNDITLLKKEL